MYPVQEGGKGRREGGREGEREEGGEGEMMGKRGRKGVQG